MRLAAAEKQEIIKLVEHSEIGINRTLLQLGINKSTFYKWYKLYLDKGSIRLEPKHSTRQRWNTISDAKGIFISESTDKPCYKDIFITDK